MTLETRSNEAGDEGGDMGLDSALAASNLCDLIEVNMTL